MHLTRPARPAGPARLEGARPDDRGAVAVVVALVVVLVLLPVAALAVDLGAAYAAEARVQVAADDAARAGVIALVRDLRRDPALDTPDLARATAAARSAALGVLCRDAVDAGAPGWRDACTGPAWATDGDPANGEVTVTRSPHAPTLDQPTDPAPQVPDTVTVVTPALTVPFALGGLVGRSEGSVRRTATARATTAWPRAGLAPLYVTPADQELPQAAPAGAWCARSAPRMSWRLDSYSATESNAPAGPACTPDRERSVARGYLAARSDLPGFPVSGWSAAPLPAGAQVALVPQVWTTVARLRWLTDSLVGAAGGRLTRPTSGTGCPGGNAASSGGYSGLEDVRLADLADPSRITRDDLHQLVLGGEAPGTSREGVLRPEILRCGRLLVVPRVAIPAPPPYLGVSQASWPVTGLRLIWVDNTFGEGDATPIATSSPNPACLQRGLYWEDTEHHGYCPTGWPLRAVTGYLLDPRLLPAVVPADPRLTEKPFLPGGLPAVVRLVPDVPATPGA